MNSLKLLVHTDGLLFILFPEYSTYGRFLSLSLFVNTPRENRVPLGFICGYPVNSSGGELYGGSMFTRSAASDTLQGKAIQAVNEKWGEDFLNRAGRETIGIPVCKKKYNPFLFHVVELIPSSGNGITSVSRDDRKQGSHAVPPEHKQVEVQVERMYGCKCHHPKRKDQILRDGVRVGWQPYGVWSLKKAMEVAKREEARLNLEIVETGDFHALNEMEDDDNETVEDDLLSDQSTIIVATDDGTENSDRRTQDVKFIRTISLPGKFTWRIRSAYDDIFKEMHGYSESDAEDFEDNINLKNEGVVTMKDSTIQVESCDQIVATTNNNSAPTTIINLGSVVSIITNLNEEKGKRRRKTS
jgi:hypothetical protein